MEKWLGILTDKSTAAVLFIEKLSLHSMYKWNRIICQKQ